MLYVQDRMNHTLAVLDNYYNDTHTLILESGVSTYNFTIPKNQDGSEYLVRGNYVVLADDKGQGWKFTIMATDETHSSLDVECEDLGLELLNKVRNSWASPGSAQPFKFYFDKVVRDTGWTLGVNEISNLSRTLSWDGRDTALKRLLSICTQFDHAEIEFKVEFKNMQVTKQVVNVYKQRGANRSDVQLVYGDTVNDIRKTTEIRELATAIQGVGGVIQKDNPVEGEPEEHVDFSSLTYDDGEYFTPTGDPFLYARVANQQFNIKDTYLEDFYDYDTQDAQELLNRTLTQLKERCQPKANYEVDLAKVDSSLNLGDTVTIIDHDYKPELLLSGRVLQIEKSYTDSSKNKATFGNFLILYSNISDQLRALQDQMNSLKPVANYMWLRYAKDDKGNGMTAMPTADTKYFAMLVNKKTGVPSDNPSDYAGHWKLIQGLDGKDGIPGATGADGKTSYTHFAYANDVSGSKDFSTSDPTGRSYMGVYSDFTKPDSNNPSDYVWSLTKGESGADGMQGAQGPKGEQGIAGKPGADGKTSYTHVAYADNASGGGFSQNPANKAYMGWYTDFTANDSTDPTKYAWSLIKGSDGSNGAPGKPGADGKTPYFHQAWADSKDGKINFSTTDPTNRGYLGTYSDFTQADSTDPSKYFWVELVGNILTGAPNLIKNTGNFKNDKHWQHNGTLTFTERHPFWKNGTEPLLKLRTTGTTEVTLSSDRFPLTKNAEYTVQFDGFQNVNISSIDVWILSRKYGSSTGFDKTQLIKGAFQLSTSNTVHTIIKFTAPSDMDEAYLRFDNNGSKTAGQAADLWLTDIKVAHENRPSPWSPSPEDAQEQIDSVNQGLADTNKLIAETPVPYVGPTAPISPKKGDQWWVKDSSNHVTAFKQWDGSKWVDSMIQQSLLNIVTLNSVTLNSAVINSPDIKAPFDFTGIDKVHFQGVTQIKDGSVNINWKIPENNQTGHTSLDASGLESIVRDPNGTLIRSARLQMGELQLGDGRVSGWLNEQDVYQNYTNQVQYLDGWSGWNNPISITRRGKMVTFSGYIAHNGGSAHINIAQFPAWARPEHTEFIVEIHFGGDTGTRTNGYGNLMLSTSGRLIINRGLGTGQHTSFGYTFIGQDI